MRSRRRCCRTRATRRSATCGTSSTRCAPDWSPLARAAARRRSSSPGAAATCCTASRSGSTRTTSSAGWTRAWSRWRSGDRSGRPTGSARGVAVRRRLPGGRAVRRMGAGRARPAARRRVQGAADAGGPARRTTRIAAIGYLERLAEIEPLDDDVERELLATWLRLGRKSRAARHYRSFRVRLMREFGERAGLRALPPRRRGLVARRVVDTAAVGSAERQERVPVRAVVALFASTSMPVAALRLCFVDVTSFMSGEPASRMTGVPAPGRERGAAHRAASSRRRRRRTGRCDWVAAGTSRTCGRRRAARRAGPVGRVWLSADGAERAS